MVTPVDSLAWLKAMAWDLRGNYDDELDAGPAQRPAHPGPDQPDLPAYDYDAHPPILAAGVVAGRHATAATRQRCRPP